MRFLFGLTATRNLKGFLKLGSTWNHPPSPLAFPNLTDFFFQPRMNSNSSLYKNLFFTVMCKVQFLLNYDLRKATITIKRKMKKVSNKNMLKILISQWLLHEKKTFQVFLLSQKPLDDKVVYKKFGQPCDVHNNLFCLSFTLNEN